MKRMLLVVTATSSLVLSGITPTRAEMTSFYNPTNRASPTGFTTDYEEYRTIGCPGRELLGKPCPVLAPAVASAKSAPAPARMSSRAEETAPAVAPVASPVMEPVPVAVTLPITTPAPAITDMPSPAVILAKDHPLVLDDVNFEFDSDKLLPGAESILNQAAVDLRSASYPRTQVDGYTDSTGPDAYNLRLSERRAQSVKAFLIGKGVPADTLTTAAFGENLFVATNSTMVGRYRNRRVELHVTE